MKPPLTTSETDARLAQVLDQYLSAAEAGRAPEKEELLARHPDLAADLEACLASLDFVKAASVKLAGAEVVEQAGAEPATGVLGDYRIIREIGRGGMGVVYEAEQISLGRRVALKVLPFAAVLDAKQLNRFKNEAHAAAQLHHINIVPVFSVGSQRGVHYYAMQYIDGQPLSAVVQELRQLAGLGTNDAATSPPANDATSSAANLSFASQFASGCFAPPRKKVSGDALAAASRTAQQAVPLGSPDVCRSSSVVAAISTHHSVTTPAYYRTVASLAAQAAEALEHAHENGVIHRDIKPSNLLLDAKGKIWITDFGLAHCQTDAGLTMTGDLVGTVRYMSPEQSLAKRIPVDHRTDIYSLAVTVYELLTLQPAFPGDDRQDLLRQIAFDDPKLPRRHNKSVPVELETIILKAMAKNPASRYGTAQEMADDLKRFLEDKPIRAKRPNIAERLGKFARRHRAVVTTAGVSAVLLLFAVAVVASLAAIWLSAERGKTATERDAAINAKKLATDRLFDAYKNEARARIYSGQPGQRHDALKAVRDAALIRRSPELRNLAIAALARTDIRLGPLWAGYPDGTDFAVFDADLDWYARADRSGTLSVRRVADDQVLFSLSIPEYPGMLRFSANRKYLALIQGHSPQRYLHIWDLDHVDKPVLKQPVHGNGFDFTPDSRQVVVAQSDGAINLFDLGSGTLLRPLGIGPVPNDLHIHPVGTRLAVSQAFGPHVQVRDLTTGDLQLTVQHPDREVYDLAWHPQDPNLLATANLGIHLWDLRTPEKPVAYLPGQAGSTTNIAFSHSGDVLASKGWGDTTVRLWDIWTGRHLVQIPGTGAGGEIALQFSRDDRRLAFYHNVTEIGLWEVEIAQEFRSLASRAKLGQGNYGFLDFSPDGRLLAAPSRYASLDRVANDGICIWELETGRELAFLPTGPTYAVRFDPRGAALFSAHMEGLYHWPMRNGPEDLYLGPPRRLGPADTAAHLSLSPDGRRLAVAYNNHGGIVFELADPPSLTSPGEQGVVFVQGRVHKVAFSSDGRWLAAAMAQGDGVMIFDAKTRKHVKTLPVRLYAGAEFSPAPDGKWLVTIAADEYCIYEVGSWERRYRLPRTAGGDGGGPVAFSPDGKVLAIVPTGLTVQLIDPATGRELANLEPPEPDRNLPGSLCFSPDGSRLVVCTTELRMLHVWDLRRLGQRLTELRLQWDLPAFPPPSESEDSQSIAVKFDLGELAAAGYFHRALASHDRGDFAQAITDYRKVIELEPNNAKALNNLAWLYVAGPLDHRDAQAALPLAERAVTLASTDWQYLNTLGVVYYRLLRYDDAVKFLTQSANLERDYEGGSAFDFFFLAMSYHRLGQPDKARDYYDRAVKWRADQTTLPPIWVEELNRFRAEADIVLAPSSPTP